MEQLVDSGYKDAAAVIAGSALEARLRQLAKKLGVSTDHITPQGSAPKKADGLNADLPRATAYSVLDQKNVTAWRDLRNKSAHGEYGEYTKEQVGLMIGSAQDFITRCAA